uniref:ATP synthase subunit a n=1 Tax=Dendrothrips minowai TaxID=1030662 RepID=A0A343WRP5_9NEOP|nr:ATP synthase F0 subunit 6 [Dendrothrips minowai]AWD37114.1 ATP synthase F0 subunit 6 [Dendrothrips minowai]
MSIFWMSDLNWMVIMFLPMFLMYSFWNMPNRSKMIFQNFNMNLSNQFLIALKTKKDGSTSFFVSLFMFFFISNLIGLVPNLFTSTSHITLNLMFSVSLWTGFFLFGWFSFTNKMFAHLVPLSTPKPLISFMVLIELISTLIRPGTLSIRLMANMVSGHLLLTLLGNSMSVSPFYILIILIMVQSMLSSLEIGVSMIQAYVFCMLLTLYSDESEYN